jgi:predicted RNA-binding protein with PIN domain
MPIQLLVDAANVMGSVPDGWWHDRKAAAERVRDALAHLTTEPPSFAHGEPLEIRLVVEGKANRIDSVPGVEVVKSRDTADDTIVDLVRAYEGADRVLVVTADRELKRRVAELGADVLGPRSVYPHKR